MDNVDSSSSPEPLTVKVIGLGNTGVRVLELLLGDHWPPDAFAVINTDPESLAVSRAANKVHLETSLLRGLGSGGDPERARALAEEHAADIKSLCEGAAVVFVIAGLGGGAGTGSAPVVARLARESGALALAFVLTPFDCEGNRRQQLAEQGLADLREAADAVICQRNQSVFKLIDENTSVIETFKLTNSLLADVVRGLWRLLHHSGLLDVPFAQLCEQLRDAHTENAFAVAEALGPTRSRDVVDKLLAHPMLDGGDVLAESDSVLVSILGGSDLTMAEVNRLMEQLNAKCPHTQITLGAAIDEHFAERLAVTVIAARRTAEAPAARGIAPGAAEDLQTQLLRGTTPARPESRFVPPAPTLPPEKMAQLLARQGKGSSRGRKPAPKLRQTQLPLEIISKGRFDKSEPTIHKGEDLDVPTYIRRGVALN
jgi:cell division protein FtsZ